MDNMKKFDGRAQSYTAGRPSYAEELLDRIYTDCGFSAASVIADVGSGTGKFSRQLLDRGSEVFCVEPNDDMRAAAEAELSGYPRFHSVNGAADGTTLGAQSVDFVTVAQAFHWFDGEKFRMECRRILKPGGKVVLLWNTRAPAAPLNRACSDLFTRYCPNFHGFNGGVQENDVRIRTFFREKYERITCDNPLRFDRNRFLSRILSSSYSLREGDAGFLEYQEAFSRLFDRYAINGTVEMPNQTTAYIGTVEE